jgi:hypothetical protein
MKMQVSVDKCRLQSERSRGCNMRFWDALQSPIWLVSSLKDRLQYEKAGFHEKGQDSVRKSRRRL